MENLTCDICDGRLVVDKGGAVYCSRCGSVYTLAAMKEKYQKLQENDSTEVVESGSSTQQAYDDKLKTVMDKAVAYFEMGDIESAEEVCRHFLAEHPNEELAQIAIENYEKYKQSVKTKGSILKGKVVSIKEFGVFVEFYKGCEGMVHISQLSTNKVANCEEVCKIGDVLWVECKGLDKMGRISYSAKDCADLNGF